MRQFYSQPKRLVKKLFKYSVGGVAVLTFSECDHGTSKPLHVYMLSKSDFKIGLADASKLCPNRNWASQKAHQCRHLCSVSVV